MWKIDHKKGHVEKGDHVRGSRPVRDGGGKWGRTSKRHSVASYKKNTNKKKRKEKSPVTITVQIGIDGLDTTEEGQHWKKFYLEHGPATMTHRPNKTHCLFL